MLFLIVYLTSSTSLKFHRILVFTFCIVISSVNNFLVWIALPVLVLGQKSCHFVHKYILSCIEKKVYFRTNALNCLISVFRRRRGRRGWRRRRRRGGIRCIIEWIPSNNNQVNIIIRDGQLVVQNPKLLRGPPPLEPKNAKTK